MSKSLSQREDRSFSIPRDNSPEVIGIPPGKASGISWSNYFLLTLSFSALVAWLIFRKRYATAGYCNKKSPKNKKLTIFEILNSVGFNSKSSFNTSFIKLSRLTPT